jgi:type I restriction enzyme S subunit
LVAEQKQLMELLNEQIISLALSSFDRPETEKLRLGQASKIISRPVIQEADESYTRIGLFNRGRGLFHKDASEADDMGESDFFWVEEGDLIISGQFAWEGAVALADKEDSGCVVSHRYPMIRGRDGITLTEYLFALLCTKHGDFLLNENSRGAAGRNRPLNISYLMKEKIPVPNIRVQEAVARAIHIRKDLFKEIIKAIDLLQERRTALISAVVTGQIDVRQLAKTEPAA